MNDVVAHIEELMKRFCGKPSAYVGSPQSLEDVLIVLEHLRDWIINGEEPPIADLGYFRHLEHRYPEQGNLASVAYGAKAQEKTADELFQAIVDEWQAYLASGYRVQAQVRDSEPDLQ